MSKIKESGGEGVGKLNGSSFLTKYIRGSLVANGGGREK